MGFNLTRKTAPIAPEDRRPAKTERNQMIMVARSAYDKWRHSFYSCAERTAASALRKRGKKNGRRMRRRKRGRELVRVAFQAQAVGRSPTFSPGGHFWRHLLVTKGGKSAPRRKRRIEGRDASRRIDRKIFLLSKFFFCAFGLIQKHQKIKHRENSGCRHLRSLSDHERLRFSHDRSGRSRRCRHCFRYFRSAIPQIGGLPKYNFERFALRSKPEERQTAAAPCGGLHRPATGGRRILRRPRTDKEKSYFDCAVDTPPRQNPNKFGSALGLRTSRRTNLRSDKPRLGKTANSVCFCPRLVHFAEDELPLR